VLGHSGSLGVHSAVKPTVSDNFVAVVVVIARILWARLSVLETRAALRLIAESNQKPTLLEKPAVSFRVVPVLFFELLKRVSLFSSPCLREGFFPVNKTNAGHA
jgi:hypothetical protein